MVDQGRDLYLNQVMSPLVLNDKWHVITLGADDTRKLPASLVPKLP